MFRPDAYLEPAQSGWPAAIRRISVVATAGSCGQIRPIDSGRFLSSGGTLDTTSPSASS